MRKFEYVIILVFCLVLAACQKAAPEPENSPSDRQPLGDNFIPAPCQMNLPFGIKLTCGMVEVPLDYSNPRGETANISVAVAHSKSANPQSDPVVFLPISPGVSSLQLMGWVTQSMGQILRDRDIIFYDPRGVGYSEPELVECPEMMGWYFQVLGRDLIDDDRLKEAVSAYNQCRDRSLSAGIDLSNYTTEQHVADLNSVRMGLGYPEINLLGSGYGYELALRLLRESAEGVRSILLTSPENSQTHYQDMSTTLEGALNKVFQSCQGDPTCSVSYPELESVYYQAVDQFNQQPVPVKIRRRGDQDGFEFDLSGFMLIELSRLLMLSSEGVSSLPNFIYEISQERTAVLDDSIWMAAYRRGFAQIAPLLSANCPVISAVNQDDVQYNQANVLLQEQHLATLRLEQAVCQEWYGKPFRPAMPFSAFADTPMLVLQGQFAPSQPVNTLRQELGEMPKAQIVEFLNTGGDIPWAQPCAARLITAFLENPESELPVSCVEQIAPIRFVPPNQEPLQVEEP